MSKTISNIGCCVDKNDPDSIIDISLKVKSTDIFKKHHLLLASLINLSIDMPNGALKEIVNDIIKDIAKIIKNLNVWYNAQKTKEKIYYVSKSRMMFESNVLIIDEVITKIMHDRYMKHIRKHVSAIAVNIAECSVQYSFVIRDLKKKLKREERLNKKM